MFVQELEDRDFESTRYTSLADEHSAWHTVHGWNSGCPLDCAAADPTWDDHWMSLADQIAEDVAARGIPCGNRKLGAHRHPSINDVRECFATR